MQVSAGDLIALNRYTNVGSLYLSRGVIRPQFANLGERRWQWYPEQGDNIFQLRISAQTRNFGQCLFLEHAQHRANILERVCLRLHIGDNVALHSRRRWTFLKNIWKKWI